MLTEVLSLVNPAAFSRAQRIHKYVSHIVAKMKLSNPWQFAVAAMMSQLGCVTLHPETIDAVYTGEAISPEERARFDAHPRIGGDLLCNIPRMEPIAWMISHQYEIHRYEQRAPREAESVRQGADILRAVLRFDEQIQRNMDKRAALNDIQSRWQYMDPRIFEALGEIEAEAGQNVVRTCALENLAPGMILNEEVRAQNGLLIVARGQEVTPSLIVKLRNFFAKNAIRGSVSVTVPRVEASAETAG